jgi:hypothetical protein
MPRKDSYRCESDHIQGKGSWVEVKALSHREWLAFRELNKIEEVNALVASHIAGWNWTDSNGEALPIPPDIATMTELERAFLINALLWPAIVASKN